MEKYSRLTFLRPLLFVVLLMPSALHAQDSLFSRIVWMENFLVQKKDHDRDSILRVLQKQMLDAADVDDKITEARAAKQLGLALISVPLYDSAVSRFIRALQIEDSLSLDAEEIVTYIAMAKVFSEVGDYHKSAELLENAMELSRPFHEVNALVYILNALGKMNALRGRKEDAQENYLLVLSHEESLSSRKPIGDAYYNLGHLHLMKGKFNQALEYHKKGLSIRRELNDQLDEAQSLNDIGELYRLMKNPDKAFANHLVALQIRTRLNDVRGMAESYNNIGTLYYARKDFPRAIANLQLGLNAAKASQYAEETLKSYEYLTFCHKENGDYQKAFEAKEAHAQYIEFLRLETIEMELLEKQNRYVLDKKELEIRHLGELQKERELKIEEQRKTQNVLSVLIGFGVIIILLIFYLYLIKRRNNKILQAAHAKVNQQNAQLQNLNATKDKFFSIISHDLKGPLNSFTAFSGMLINHTDDLSKEEIQMLAREIDKNLKNLFALLENLLEWSRSQTGNIEFKPEHFSLNELLKQNQELLATQARNKKIQLRYGDGKSFRVTAHKHSVNTVIRNLISNAIKFTPEGGSVTVEARHDEGKVTVSITDTGVGMSRETIEKLFRIDTKYSTQGTANEKGTGLGLILCKDFVEKNGGSIGVQSEPGKGSTFFFTLPLAGILDTTAVDINIQA